MNKKENKKIKEQVLTDRMDVGTKEFNEFRAILLNKSKERSNDQKRIIELMAIYLNAFEIRQNKFANYIGLRPSNLTKLIK